MHLRKNSDKEPDRQIRYTQNHSLFKRSLKESVDQSRRREGDDPSQDSQDVDDLDRGQRVFSDGQTSGQSAVDFDHGEQDDVEEPNCDVDGAVQAT